MQNIPRSEIMNNIPRRDALKTLGLTAIAAAAVTPLLAAEERKSPAAKDSEVGFKDGKYVLPPCLTTTPRSNRPSTRRP